MDDLTTERDFDSQASLAIDMLGLIVDMLSKGVCTAGHWHTSGRLVKELLVYILTVLLIMSTVLGELRKKTLSILTF